jgi:photosystem II stability/assembly factor-like uncharacterized protein
MPTGRKLLWGIAFAVAGCSLGTRGAQESATAPQPPGSVGTASSPGTLGPATSLDMGPSSPSSTAPGSAVGGMDDGGSPSGGAQDGGIQSADMGGQPAPCVPLLEDPISFSWTTESVGDGSSEVRTLSADPSNIYVGTDHGDVYASAGNGSWAKVAPAADGQTFVAAVADDQSGLLAAETHDGTGLVLHSADGGHSWTSASVPVPLQDIRSADQSIYALSETSIWQSIDDGMTWTELDFQSPGPAATSAKAIWTTGDEIGVLGSAPGADGQPLTVSVFHASQDAGHNWSRTVIPAGEALALYGRGQNTLLLVGFDGFIARSDNFGSTWTTQCTAGVSATLESISGSDQTDEFFVVGDGGTLLHTVDGGKNWKTISVPAVSNLHAVGIQKGELFIGADGGAILHGRPSVSSPRS